MPGPRVSLCTPPPWRR